MTRVSPVARSMALIRPASRIGLAQWPVAASWASQRWKSSRAASSRMAPADAPAPRPCSVLGVRATAGTVMLR